MSASLPETDIRQPTVAGKFYPDDPAELRRDIAGYLRPGTADGDPTKTERAIGLMLPHAGYVFSGAVAGLTLAQSSLMPPPDIFPALTSGDQPGYGNERTFVILGPSHTGRGVPLSVWPGGAWRSPLGDMMVDEGFAAGLVKTPGSDFQYNHNAHFGDHAIEVIVPFLQVIAPSGRIVPITVSLYEPEGLRRAGEILAAQVAAGEKSGRQVVIVTSSDMNHFLPHEANMRQDALALDRLRALDPDGLFSVVSARRISMCGFASACLMLHACLRLGAKKCRITAHTSSGETGRRFGADMERVVGYAGAIIT